MGSKPVREAHMKKYGAPLSEVNGVAKKKSKEEREQDIERLAAPKTKAQKFAYSAKAATTGKAQLENLFPLHDDVPEVSTVPKNAEYPEDWRRQPTPASMDTPLTWVYGRITMTRLQGNAQTIAQAHQLVERLLSEHGVKPANDLTSRREVRSMLRSPKKYGVLIDIVATRRNILSGSPHDTALSIYKLIDERYPIQVKFVFIGITDNGTKRVARDVFSGKNSIASAGPGDSASSIVGTVSSGKPSALSFASIDSEHLYIVHPKGDQGDEMRARGEEARLEREAERKRRHCTPKHVPPPPPEWLKKVQERQSRSRATTPGPGYGGTMNSSGFGKYSGELNDSRPGTSMSGATFGSSNTTSTKQNVVLEECPRCWLFGRARSPSPTGGPEAAAANKSTSRPLSRQNETTTSTATILDENELSQSDSKGRSTSIFGKQPGSSPSFSFGGMAESAVFSAKMARRWRHRRSIALAAEAGPLITEEQPLRPPSQMQQLKMVVNNISEKHAKSSSRAQTPADSRGRSTSSQLSGNSMGTKKVLPSLTGRTPKR